MKRIRLADLEAAEVNKPIKPRRAVQPDTKPADQGPLYKEFIKYFSTIARHKHRQEVFKDFLELSFCATAKRTLGPEDVEKMEARYMAIVARHEKDDIRALPPLLGMAITAIGAGGCDFLGKVASEMELLNKKSGQFFTPYDLCRLMAEMQLSEVGSIIDRNGFVTISEPACGAAGMMLAAADTIEAKGYDLRKSMIAEVVDISESSFYMAYLQLSYRGIPAKVIRGNTLSNEIFEIAYTPAYFTFLANHSDPWAKKRSRIRLNKED